MKFYVYCIDIFIYFYIIIFLNIAFQACRSRHIKISTSFKRRQNINSCKQLFLINFYIWPPAGTACHFIVLLVHTTPQIVYDRTTVPAVLKYDHIYGIPVHTGIRTGTYRYRTFRAIAGPQQGTVSRYYDPNGSYDPTWGSLLPVWDRYTGIYYI